MPLHSRPIPAPKTLPHVVSNPTTYLERPEPPPAPRPARRRVSESDPSAEPNGAREESRAARPVAEGRSQPWYRSEPWLAVMLAAFVPLVAAVLAPDSAQYALIGLSLLLLVIGAVMLVRHGVFRPHSLSEPERE